MEDQYHKHGDLKLPRTDTLVFLFFLIHIRCIASAKPFRRHPVCIFRYLLLYATECSFSIEILMHLLRFWSPLFGFYQFIYGRRDFCKWYSASSHTKHFYCGSLNPKFNGHEPLRNELMRYAFFPFPVRIWRSLLLTNCHQFITLNFASDSSQTVSSLEQFIQITGTDAKHWIFSVVYAAPTPRCLNNWHK